MVRLIRSKGVGVYFVTQNPADVPDKVLGQLGNRVQHALRAFSPRDQKAVKAAAETMHDNPGLDEEAVITALGVGEALVSCLDEKGRPSIVERALIIPPQAQIGPINEAERKAIIQDSLLVGHYEKAVDRESAYEKLKGRAGSEPSRDSNSGSTGSMKDEARQVLKGQTAEQGGGWLGDAAGDLIKGNGRGDSILETLAKSAARTIGSTVGREIIRGVLGSILGGRKR